MQLKTKKRIDKMKLIMVLIICLVISCSFLAYRYVKTLARGSSILNKSLIINNFSTTPSAATGSGAVWNSTSFPLGKVNFGVGVRGRSGTINYYFWSNCPNYDKNTAYDVNGLNTVCGFNYQYNTAISTFNLYRDHSFPYTYATAGVYKPVILVERDGVYMHKGVDITLLPYIDLSVEYSDNSSFSPFASAGAGIYSPAIQTVNSIGYGQYARLRWLTQGVPAGNKCTAQTTGGPPNFTGEKELNGLEDLGQMRGGTYIYRLTCDYNGATNYDEVVLNVPPYVELTASLSGFASVTSVNGETIDLGTAASPVPLNSKISFTGKSKGADRCTLGSSPSGFLSGTWVNGANDFYNIKQSFTNVLSLGIDSTTSFTMSCSRTIGATTLTSQTVIRAITSNGNCAFRGNNQIQAMTFCNNSLVTMNGASNIEFKGSFVAQSFSVDTNSANVSFLYDYNNEEKVPPGFRFLNIPTSREKGNSNN